MKFKLNQAVTSLVLGTLVCASVLTAQSKVPAKDDDDISWPSDTTFPDRYDLHGNNRAVGFGSVLLKESGSNYDQWQAIEAFSWCGLPFPKPEDPSNPFPGNGNDSSGGLDLDCGSTWDVMVTIEYRLEVCPDGRAYIARSGDGVIVEDRNTGSFYGWTEAYGCLESETPFAADKAMDKNRPLNRKYIKRSLK